MRRGSVRGGLVLGLLAGALLAAGPGCACSPSCPLVWCVSECGAGATGTQACSDECLSPSVLGQDCGDGGPCCSDLGGGLRCPGLPDAGMTALPGEGARRGCPGCAPARPLCVSGGEYVVSVGCHPMLGVDAGLSYAVGGIAGAWCYPLPPACTSNPSCACLMEKGAFSADGGLGLACPGAYWFCIEGTGGGVPELHCNPP